MENKESKHNALETQKAPRDNKKIVSEFFF